MYSTASEPGLRRSFQLFMCLYWNYKALGNFYQIYISRFISMESPAMCLTIMIHILCLRTDISWKLPYVGLKYIFHGNSEEACYTEVAENSKGLQNKLSYSLRQKWLGHFNQTLFFSFSCSPRPSQSCSGRFGHQILYANIEGTRRPQSVPTILTVTVGHLLSTIWRTLRIHELSPSQRGRALERRTCNSEAPSSSPALTASWICSR